jgi:hypothetical protein
VSRQTGMSRPKWRVPGRAPLVYYVGQGYVFEARPVAELMTDPERFAVLQATRARLLPRRARRALVPVGAWRRGVRAPSAVTPHDLALALVGRRVAMTPPRRSP